MPLATSNSSTWVLAASAISAVMVAAFAAFFMGGPVIGGGKDRNLTEIDDDDDDDVQDIVDYNKVDGDFITEQEVTKIFERLFMEMQAVMAALSQQIQAVQASGQRIPEKHLMQMLKSELERALQFKQHNVCEEFKIDEDCFEEATLEFLQQGNPKVKKAVETLQKFWEAVTGESVTSSSSPSSSSSSGSQTKRQSDVVISKETLLHAADVYFNALTECMADLIRGLRQMGKDLNTRSVAEELQLQFGTVANEIGEQALRQKLDLSVADFHQGIEYHASNPEVARALNILRMKQQQQMMSMGVPMSMF